MTYLPLFILLYANFKKKDDTLMGDEPLSPKEIARRRAHEIYNQQGQS